MCKSIFSCHAKDSQRHNCIAAVQSLVVYSATNPSLPPSVAQISAFDVDSEDFQEINLQAGRGPDNHCQSSNFIESITRDQSACVLWLDLHNRCITSSNFGKVIHRCDSTDTTGVPKLVMSTHTRKTSDAISVARTRANNSMDNSIDNSMSNSTSHMSRNTATKNAKNWHTNIVTVTISTTNKYYE